VERSKTRPFETEWLSAKDRIRLLMKGHLAAFPDFYARAPGYGSNISDVPG
jgi:hypothetical protein